MGKVDQKSSLKKKKQLRGNQSCDAITSNKLVNLCLNAQLKGLDCFG